MITLVVVVVVIVLVVKVIVVVVMLINAQVKQHNYWNTSLTYAFQPLKPLPARSKKTNFDYLIPTEPSSPEILKQKLSVHKKCSYTSQGVKQTSKYSWRQRVLSYTGHLELQQHYKIQSPDESHCIHVPRIFCDSAPTNLSWNSRMLHDLCAIGTTLSKTHASFTHNHPALSCYMICLYMVIISWNPVVNIRVTGQLLHYRKRLILRQQKRTAFVTKWYTSKSHHPSHTLLFQRKTMCFTIYAMHLYM